MDTAVRNRALAGAAGALAAYGIYQVVSGWDSRLYATDNIVQLALRMQDFYGFMREADVKKMRQKADKLIDRSVFDADVKKYGWVQQTVQVPVSGGSIPMIVLKPAKGGENLPVVLWYHGGGMVILGAADGIVCGGPFGLGLLEHFAGKAVFASVDYRLAPEHPFPTGVEDAIAAAQWMHQNARQFGGDPSRLSVGGFSAGGYLAAAVHQAARDRGFPLAYAVMMAPMLRRGATTPSFLENGDIYILRTHTMLNFWLKYAPDPKMADDPRCTPILGIGQGKLAPCTVVTCDFDVLRDEGIEYARALEQAGVQVTRVTCRTSHAAGVDKERLKEVLNTWSSAIGAATSR
eukprot:TRINITY_DN55663_c0_g1_i1.p1 TRINITY_DN55663_c0_g1~~TRINITY_DN55663_c0_g1_i1.p1  ORF type:complete len:372 (+),score=104.56 TRINITY_DN55663_c0_g1_i1:75-1118(+)